MASVWKFDTFLISSIYRTRLISQIFGQLLVNCQIKSFFSRITNQETVKILPIVILFIKKYLSVAFFILIPLITKPAFAFSNSTMEIPNNALTLLKVDIKDSGSVDFEQAMPTG